MDAATEAIARILANVDRKRLGYQSIVQLDDLEHQDASYYREQAACAIQALESGDDGRGRSRHLGTGTLHCAGTIAEWGR